MEATRVVELLAGLASAGVVVWLIGGWAIDALLGQERRPHDDLDILVADTDVGRTARVLARDGYRGDLAPVGATYLVDTAGHQIDVHVVSLQADGAAVYLMDDGESWTYPPGALDGRGRVLGRAVRCLSPQAMMLDHATGYALDAVHQGDVEALAVAFSIPVPPHQTA
jgi:lincosamide nucleotidyltransferase A/C/D/E